MNSNSKRALLSAAGVLVIAALAGCNASAGGGTASPAPMPIDCKVADYAGFVGKPQSIIAASTFPQGVVLRVVKNGEPVTMDYLQWRVNFLLDDAGIIREVTCG
jgi:hypothetical protein